MQITSLVILLLVLPVLGYLLRNTVVERHFQLPLKSQIFGYILATTALSVVGLIAAYVASVASVAWSAQVGGISSCMLAFDAGYILAALANWRPYTK